MEKSYIIGIDEAWRGPWAWPVVAWGFLCQFDFDFSVFPGLTDSKKCSEKKREELYNLIEIRSEKWWYAFASAEKSAEEIDILGIREANRQAMEEVIHILIHSIPSWSKYIIQIDGRDNYKFRGIDSEKIYFIIHGDLTEKVISAASIVAKVTRDRKMCDFSVEYPEYNFNLHKGYGTRKHQEALLHYGITPLHRKSYAPIKRLISDNS
jgi:ribonuclease HII